MGLLFATITTKMVYLEVIDPKNMGGLQNSRVTYIEAVQLHKCTIRTVAGKQELLNYARLKLLKGGDWLRVSSLM